MSRFLADENFPGASIRLLREAGHEVTAIIEEMAGAEDTQVLARAVQEKQIVLTFDRDYGELIYGKRLPAPPGVVYFRLDKAPPGEPAKVLLLILALNAIRLEGNFTTLEEAQFRQRLLP